MSYCPAKDVVAQNIKRAHEKKKKNDAIHKDYLKSKRRNQYTAPIELKGTKASEDKTFTRIAPGKFRKTA